MIRATEFDCPTVKRLSLFIERRRKYTEDIHTQRIRVIRKHVPTKVGDLIEATHNRIMRVTEIELNNHATHGFVVSFTGHLVTDGKDETRKYMKVEKPLAEFV